MSDVMRFGSHELRPSLRELRSDGALVPLGARAFDVLVALAERRDRIVTKQELLEVVWSGLVVEENNLQVQVGALRKALGASAIATIPGRGYRLTLVPDADTSGVPSSSAAAVPVPSPGREHDLIGRAGELDALVQAVGTHRLVTVIGPGGVGKTRLSQAALQALAARFADGTALVELAQVSDPTRVAATVARAIGIDAFGRPAADALAAALAGRRMLVMLDNAEHVAESVGLLVAPLLSTAAGVHWLVTSQQRLRVGDERLFRLAPLALPVSVDSATASPAVALFVARVQAMQPQFRLDAGNEDDVTTVCRLLDGLPLALELGAARVPSLGVAGVRAHLDQRLRLLRGGMREAPARHQSLAAALEWTHGLLSAPAQRVFARLGVFVGGFSLALAQAVATDVELDAIDVADLLGVLIDHSMVEPDSNDPPRYRLLETIRAFALHRLALAGEKAAVQRRHAVAIEALFREADDDGLADRRSRRQTLHDTAPDFDNLRAALAWALEAPDESELAARIAGYGHSLMFQGGHAKEWHERISPLAGRLDSGALSVLAKALSQLALGVTGFFAGVPAAQRAQLLADAASGFLASGDPQRHYGALSVQLFAAAQCRDAAQVEFLSAELDTLTQRYRPGPGLRAGVECHRAVALYMAGRLDEALVAYDNALPLAEASDNDRRVYVVLIDRCHVLRALGRLDEAGAGLESLLERSLREDFDAQRIAAIRIALAATHALRGTADAARAQALLALPMLEATMGWRNWGGDAIAVAAALDDATAMRLLGCFEAVCEQTGVGNGRHTMAGELAGIRVSVEDRHGGPCVDAWRREGREFDDAAAVGLFRQAIEGHGARGLH